MFSHLISYVLHLYVHYSCKVFDFFSEVLYDGPLWPLWGHVPLDQQLVYFRTLKLPNGDTFGVVES